MKDIERLSPVSRQLVLELLAALQKGREDEQDTDLGPVLVNPTNNDSKYLRQLSQ